MTCKGGYSNAKIKLDYNEVIGQLNDVERALEALTLPSPPEHELGQNQLGFTKEWFEREETIKNMLKAYTRCVQKNIEDTRANVAILKKQFLGLKIVDVNGNKISAGKSWLRYLGYILSGIMYIGYIMVAFTEGKRGLHDFIANTYVVKSKANQVEDTNSQSAI